MQKRVFDITFADVSMESRNLREIASLIDGGFKVFVVSSEMMRSLPSDVEDAEYIIYATPINKQKRTLLRNLLRQTKYLRSKEVWNADAMILHGFTTLLVGYLALIGVRKKPKIVYHSHEFELARNASTKRSLLKMRCIKRIEGILCRKTDMIIVPSQSIAARIKDIYHLKYTPLTVLSVPAQWKIDASICEKMRGGVLHSFDSSNGYLVMYHGAIMRGRGIENIIRAIALLNDVFLVILGFGTAEYIAELYDLAEKCGCRERVRSQPGVSQKELWKYIGAMDLETCLLPSICESYELALPNKLFESIQSLTPILASDNKEIKRIVTDYNVGYIVKSLEPTVIAQGIADALSNEERLLRTKEELAKAKAELCWENESKKFLDGFNRIFWRA